MSKYDPNNIIGSFLPKVNFKRIILEPATGNKLIITVDLVIKEILDPEDPVSSWYENQDFSKFLDVGILQVTKKEVIEDLSKSRFAFMEIFKQQHVNLIENDWNTASKDMSYKRIPLTDQNQTAIEDLSYVTDTDGNRIYTISYQTQFEVNTQNPSDLAYFADVMLDVDAIKDEFGLNEDLDFTGNNNPSSEIVISNGEVKSTTHVFVTQDGDLWPGQVHYHGEQNPTPDGYIGWMAGLEHAPDTTQPRLIMKSVPNYVVQDFRQVQRIERRPLDLNLLSKTGSQVLKSIKTFIAGQEYKHAGKNSYFTKLYHSKDLSGRARLLFGVDEKSLMIDKSNYGSFYDSSYNSLKDNVVLKSMKVVRNRVNKLEPGDTTTTLLDQTESDNPHIGDKKTINFEVASLNSNNPLSDIKQLPQNMIGSTGIKYFTVTDNDVAEEERGFYQYSVELQYEDNTIEYFKTKLANLDHLVRDFKLYNEEARRIGISQFYQQVSDPHIDTELEVGQLPIGDPKSAFNTVSNRFNKWFIEDIDGRYDLFQRPNVKAISAFFELVTELGGFPAGTDFGSMISTMFYMSNPELGSPAGISKVIATIETTTQQIRTLLGISWTTIPANDTTSLGVSESSTSKKSGNKKRTINVQKHFKAAEEIFDASEENGVGYDFLSLTKNFSETNLNGPMIVGSDFYKNRVDLETLKYFKTVNAGIAYQNFPDLTDNLDRTKYTYLSPSFVRLSSYHTYKNTYFIDSNAQGAEQQRYSNLGSMILTKNSTDKNISELTNLIGGSSTESISPAAAALAQVFAEKGCVAFVSENTIQGPTFEEAGFNLSSEKTDELQEKKKNFSIQKGNEAMGSAQEKAFQQMAMGAFGGGVPTASPFKAGFLSDLKSTYEASMKTYQISDLDFPNHLKSIIGDSARKRQTFATQDKYSSPQALPKFYMNYENIMKVEYLESFSDAQILNPVWKPITKSLFSDTTEPKLYFCRLKRYENKEYNINENTAMKLPIYNQYFIIQHGPSPGQTQVTQPATQPEESTGTPLAEPVIQTMEVSTAEASEYTYGNIEIYKDQPTKDVFVNPSEIPANIPPGNGGGYPL